MPKHNESEYVKMVRRHPTRKYILYGKVQDDKVVKHLAKVGKIVSSIGRFICKK